MEKQVFNPYLPSYEYVPDGEPHVFGSRVYVYGSHDRFNGKAFCVRNYVCWSAPVDDLTDWKFEGEIYRKDQDRYLPDAKDRRLFAPDVQRGPDGRYYLYYAFDFSGVIGVAVCDTPAGKYEYYGNVHYEDGTVLGTREDDYFQYDPGVLTDTDGKVYLYTGFRPEGEMAKRFSFARQTAPGGMVTVLDKDMVTIRKGPNVFLPAGEEAVGTDFEGHGFFEAASIRKVENVYYFLYSSENGHELCYATSTSPCGGFRYRGVVISNGDIGLNGRTSSLNYTGTNHGGIEKIGDQWYVFYHRQTNGNPYSRQGCAEKIQLLEDGSIPQVEITSCGLNDGPLLGKGCYNAGIACNLMSKNGAVPYVANTQVSPEHPFITQDGEDGKEQYITNMQDGAVAGYKYFRMEQLRKIGVQTRGNGNGKILVKTSLDGKSIAELKILPSEEWNMQYQDIQVPDGKTGLWFTYQGTENIAFKKFELI